MELIDITSKNIDSEHICCAFSDKKCTASYKLKKDWLRGEFEKGYRFCRLDERAKVFIEYGPAEYAWLPVSADNFFNINCFWVSGKYKGNGWGKALLTRAATDAENEGRDGLVTVVGKKKFNFMSNGKWFLKQGFKEVDRTDSGFVLLAKTLKGGAAVPFFNRTAKEGRCPTTAGLVVYYSNRCPYAEYHVTVSLRQTAEKLGLPLTEIKLNTMEEARLSPSPATIFSLYRDGEFVTTDLSVCVENRFRKFFNMM